MRCLHELDTASLRCGFWSENSKSGRLVAGMGSTQKFNVEKEVNDERIGIRIQGVIRLYGTEP
jgi:hypothetical protein